MLPVDEQYQIAIELLQTIRRINLKNASQELDARALVESINELPEMEILVARIFTYCDEAKFSFSGDWE